MPDVMPAELLRNLGAGWAVSPQRPKIDEDGLRHWDELIEMWIADSNMPLFVRRFNERYPRGSVFLHQNGREMIPCDNSPAQWAYVTAYEEPQIEFEELQVRFLEERIPIAMAFKPTERANARYRGSAATTLPINRLGWKLCHIRPVGLGRVGELEQVPSDILTNHFRLLMSPTNMFVLPREMGAWAESSPFLEGFVDNISNRS